MQFVSHVTPSSPLQTPPASRPGRSPSPNQAALPADRMMFATAIVEGAHRESEPDRNRIGGSGLARLARTPAAGYTAYKNLEPAKSAIEGIKGALGQPAQLPGAALTAGKTFARAGMFSAAIVGGLSLLEHGWKVLSGKESMASAARNVAIDAAGGLGGGFTATALAGLGAVVLGTVGLTGVGLTIVSAVIGILGYGPGEKLGRSLAQGLVG